MSREGEGKKIRGKRQKLTNLESSDLELRAKMHAGLFDNPAKTQKGKKYARVRTLRTSKVGDQESRVLGEIVDFEGIGQPGVHVKDGAYAEINSDGEPRNKAAQELVDKGLIGLELLSDHDYEGLSVIREVAVLRQMDELSDEKLERLEMLKWASGLLERRRKTEEVERSGNGAGNATFGDAEKKELADVLKELDTA